MTINLSTPAQPSELTPRIIVFGVGGAGCNAVNNMIRSKLEGVECVVANTDSQALSQCLAERKIQLGLSITQGLGAGSRPEIGRAAAEEGLDEIEAQMQGAHMAFITAGMGGGTGTGAAPVIARAARERGILTVGVVTKPFHFEGSHRMRIAEAGLEELQEVVDTLIVIPNQNLFRVANEKTTFSDAFAMADQVLHSGVRGITDLMVMPGLINLDFADIRTVMSEMGKAMMGAGEASGENRALEAAEAAISNPLLDDVSMAGARGLLINITGGGDMTLYEVDEAANRVRDEVDASANIIFGSTFDDALDGKLRVSVFATGIDSVAVTRPKPVEVKVVKPEALVASIEDPLAMMEADPAPAAYSGEMTSPVYDDQPGRRHLASASEETRAMLLRKASAALPGDARHQGEMFGTALPHPDDVDPTETAARAAHIRNWSTPDRDRNRDGHGDGAAGPAVRTQPVSLAARSDQGEPEEKREPLFTLPWKRKSEAAKAERKAEAGDAPEAPRAAERRPELSAMKLSTPIRPADHQPETQPAYMDGFGDARDDRRDDGQDDQPDMVAVLTPQGRDGGARPGATGATGNGDKRVEARKSKHVATSAANEDEDLLAIPAFLRRQAN